ncbi:MAG: transketolase C-terminal domain-containing protein [Spirochaetia bacterium]|jgi:transketolase N-terminal domain/subunit/transketolase C-terminal domain/subunit|nr:transketolase C-terminal domain-containing protein [Spirochaetia bacterium]
MEFSSTNEGLASLLRIKDSEIRILCLEQGRDAVDRGIHIGGAFSAVVPLVALYYGGFMRYSVEEPTRLGQDMFVLSKGHAVAALASVYADLGYFDKALLKNSRSYESILNGHPGPLLAGIHIATGPEGHGLGVAQGFALAGKEDPRFDVFCLTGDGEIQAGMIWEAVMFAGAKKVDNLCLMVDINGGQLDNPRATAFPMNNIEGWFESFGWKVVTVDSTDYPAVLQALGDFKQSPRNGKPTAILCRTRKGSGGFSSFCVSHKVDIPLEIATQEIKFQEQRKMLRIERYQEVLASLAPKEAAEMEAKGRSMGIGAQRAGARVRKAQPRDKRIPYDPKRLPVLDPSRSYAASWVVSECMKEFGRSGKVATVDADLASTSGLEGGLAWADSTKAFNVGVAESNMINIGEALAVLGNNTWVSTFCPFFDWRVMRRIAIGYQERREAIESSGWLSEGHNLDLTFLATAPNFETKTNGSTHMGNDDALLFSELAHLKIIDISCPNQLIGFMKWVMEGNKGLIYARIMRAASAVLYGSDFIFDYGKGYRLRGGEKDQAVIVSAGRGVYEALTAATLLEKEGIEAGVIDMPSFDSDMMATLAHSGKLIILVEQNNGFLYKRTKETFFGKEGAGRIIALNTLDSKGERRFIHSATYAQLLEHFTLSPKDIARRVQKELGR